MDAAPDDDEVRRQARRQDAVLRAFFDADGRLTIIPARHAKRLVVLDHLAQRFEPGERYSELEVNDRLRAAHDDVAALRRYLVDEGFLTREGGVYWRSGGSAPTSSQPSTPTRTTQTGSPTATPAPSSATAPTASAATTTTPPGAPQAPATTAPGNGATTRSASSPAGVQPSVTP